MNNINNIFNISNIADININKDSKEISNEFNSVNELNILSYNKLRKMKRKIYENKYDNIVDFLINRSVLKKNNRIKINDSNYFFPNLDNYKMLLDYDFKLNELKSISKHYSIKVNGNKEFLLSRLYNYLYLTDNATKIQSHIRKFYVQSYIILQGPARSNRSLCINKNDFCTMADIETIPIEQFFSVKENEHIYGFDIMSIYNLFIQGNSPDNPFTKTKFNSNILKNVLKFIKYSKILKININTNFDDLVVNNELDKLNLKAISIFQKINMLGNYTNSSWFTSLNRINLVLFIKELIDIWNYRANLDDITKINICPPTGNPFKNIVNSNLNILDFIKLRKIATTIIDNMISSGIDIENQKLGAFYVLSGLTLVNIDAANAMPWLYQSVMHN